MQPINVNQCATQSVVSTLRSRIIDLFRKKAPSRDMNLITLGMLCLFGLILAQNSDEDDPFEDLIVSTRVLNRINTLNLAIVADKKCNFNFF